MNIFRRVAYAGKILLNSSLPNAVEWADVDKSEQYNPNGVDLADTVPSKVNRTVRNRRFASRDPQVAGILLDLMTKTNGKYTLEGDSEAVKHIEKMAEEWDLDRLIDEALWKGFVDGQGFMYQRIVENHIQPQWLAYDGRDFDILELYDGEGDLIIYKQIIKKNNISPSSQIHKRFRDVLEDVEDYEKDYGPDKIVHFKYLERDNRPHALVDNVLDDVYYKRSLKDLMVDVVNKNTAVMKITMGNEKKMNSRLTKEQRDTVIDEVTDYHSKRAICLPYGIDAEMVMGSNIPDIPSYLAYYEKCIYIGLNTPEAVFSSESSNRATADIQLDSPTTGRVLFLEYNQAWVKKYFEKGLFKNELELQGIKGEVTIEFEQQQMTDEEIQAEETDPNSLHKPIVKKGQENQDRTDNNSIKKTESSTPNSKNHDVPNKTQSVQRNKKKKKK